jgi:hypothetical protein
LRKKEFVGICKNTQKLIENRKKEGEESDVESENGESYIRDENSA